MAESGNGKLTLVEPRRRGAPMVRTFATLPVDPETGLGPVDVALQVPEQGLGRAERAARGDVEAISAVSCA